MGNFYFFWAWTNPPGRGIISTYQKLEISPNGRHFKGLKRLLQKQNDNKKVEELPKSSIRSSEALSRKSPMIDKELRATLRSFCSILLGLISCCMQSWTTKQRTSFLLGKHVYEEEN